MNSDLKIFTPYHIDNLIRLGNKHDGGYVSHLPSLKDADCLINYGVGYNIAFERDFFTHTQKPTLAFDPTMRDFKFASPKLRKGDVRDFFRHVKNYLVWLVKERTLPKYKIKFISEGIAATNRQDYKSFEYHFEKYLLHNKRFAFKLDVEGAEYEVFEDKTIYYFLQNAVQIFVEFHYVKERMPKLIEIFKNLSKTHALIHIHANNHAHFFEYNGKNVPGAIEATFLRRDYLMSEEFSKAVYPREGLDESCDRLKEDIRLDFFR